MIRFQRIGQKNILGNKEIKVKDEKSMPYCDNVFLFNNNHKKVHNQHPFSFQKHHFAYNKNKNKAKEICMKKHATVFSLQDVCKLFSIDIQR